MDGQVIEGRSYIDESMVTGESKPALKTIGDPSITGTINNNGPLFVKVSCSSP